MATHDTAERYTGPEYREANPDWHVSHSPWKADLVVAALGGWRPRSICEVGCGAGEILRILHERLEPERSVGFEIAPAAHELCLGRTTAGLEFVLGDASESDERFDLMLLMDVIEHVEDPIGFLRGLRARADRTILHIPLDLSVQSVLRRDRLMHARRSVGHLHYFTPETAVATVEDAGYAVCEAEITRVTVDLPVKSVKARVARLPRRVLPPAVVARTLGGFSLLVSAANQPAAAFTARASAR